MLDSLIYIQSSTIKYTEKKVIWNAYFPAKEEWPLEDAFFLFFSCWVRMKKKRKRKDKTLFKALIFLIKSFDSKNKYYFQKLIYGIFCFIL